MPHSIEIQYVPSQVTYAERELKLVGLKSPSTMGSLPLGFPREAPTGMTWTKNTFTEAEWVVELDVLHKEEIHKALAFFKSLKIPLGFISPETFPLPLLGPIITDRIATDVYNGKGFAVLRGVPVEEFDGLDKTIVHAGVSTYVGRLRGRQDRHGNLVTRHIKDVTGCAGSGAIGTAQYTADAQVFHTDFGEVVSLCCLGTAAEGGTSHLASLGQIYNEMVAKKPGVVHTLARNWPFPTFDDEGTNTQRPVLYSHDEKLMIQYSRRLFTGFKAFANADAKQKLTLAQQDAMDTLEFLAQKHCVSMELQKGDIQYVNSLGVLHARDAFKDDANHTRELTRLWIRSEEHAWSLPQILQTEWQHLFYSIPKAEEDFCPIEAGLKLTDTTFGRGQLPVPKKVQSNLLGQEWGD